MRPQAPVPLTMEEHRELGQELRATNARLQELCKVVVAVYGPQARAAFVFQKAAEDLKRLCQEMEAQAQADLPGAPVAGIYT